MVYFYTNFSFDGKCFYSNFVDKKKEWVIDGKISNDRHLNHTSEEGGVKLSFSEYSLLESQMKNLD